MKSNEIIQRKENWETAIKKLDEGSLVMPIHRLRDIVIDMIEDLDVKNDTKILADIARMFGKSVFYKDNKVVIQDKDFDFNKDDDQKED